MSVEHDEAGRREAGHITAGMGPVQDGSGRRNQQVALMSRVDGFATSTAAGRSHGPSPRRSDPTP